MGRLPLPSVAKRQQYNPVATHVMHTTLRQCGKLPLENPHHKKEKTKTKKTHEENEVKRRKFCGEATDGQGGARLGCGIN